MGCTTLPDDPGASVYSEWKGKPCGLERWGTGPINAARDGALC